MEHQSKYELALSKFNTHLHDDEIMMRAISVEDSLRSMPFMTIRYLYWLVIICWRQV